MNTLGVILASDSRVTFVHPSAAHLALHYLNVNRTPECTLKSIVLLGSMGRSPLIITTAGAF